MQTSTETDDCGEITPERVHELLKKAKQNDAEACYDLYFHYTYGPDPRTNCARRWLEKAASLNYPSAIFEMARMRLRSNNPHAMKGAMRYLQRAAELGSPEAQYELAKILHFGTYGEADKEKAIEWYTKAAEQGWEIAIRDIAVRYHEQLLAGDSSAAEPMLHWLRKAAETGFPSSRKMLASLLLDGNGVPADLDEALYWYGMAAKHGDPEANLILGSIYWDGEFVAQDLPLAVSYFRKAAELGNGDAKFNLSTAYFCGTGVEKDVTTGLDWLLQAGEEGHLLAAKELSNIYGKGAYGIAPDPQLRLKWLMRASQLGDQECTFALRSVFGGLENMLAEQIRKDGWDNVFDDDLEM